MVRILFLWQLFSEYLIIDGKKCIADIPPAMALGVEPEEIGLMKRKPRNPKQGVLTKVTWIVIFVQSMLIALLTIAVYVVSLNYFRYELESAQSLVEIEKFNISVSGDV